MKIYDVTVTLRPGMPTWPGEPGPEIAPLRQISQGDGANVSLLRLGAHTGTHVDAPLHFIAGGAPVEDLPLEALVGRGRVVEIREPGPITASTLEQLHLSPKTPRLLFKTQNGRLWEEATFSREFVALSPEAARWLVERQIRLVGIDYLSIEPFGSPGHPTHLTLLKAGVVVVEGLDLRHVPPGEYLIACLPLKIRGGDGAPARVALIEGL